ncbi:hypothetical protein [Flavobacterium sp. GSP6]|uniref:hypothetical protein n=1 Tax=Flavobacterium sp. GSP6 TaxID=2497488 RepID=UPI000F89D0AF|nr:hypothetical protein [Flavobacterium sp. GSP6]RTZ03258.1 hypothetical protein EKM03_13370 [Flavobacterium sp. GSP6]
MGNISNHNFNGVPIDGSMRSQTQYNLFAGYLAEGFRASAARSLPGDISIFGFFFAIINLLACIAAGALLLIGMLLVWLFRLIFKAKPPVEEIYEDPSEETVSNKYSPEMIDWLLSDEYAELCESRRNNK